MIVKSRPGTGNPILIDVLEVMAMVVTDYTMVVMRGDSPGREGETVYIREDSSSAVQWAMNAGWWGEKR